MIRAAILLALLSITACANHEPPMTSGAWHQMNVGKWSFNDNALTTPPPGFSK